MLAFSIFSLAMFAGQSAAAMLPRRKQIAITVLIQTAA